MSFQNMNFVHSGNRVVFQEVIRRLPTEGGPVSIPGRVMWDLW
jgi:hypothetical protein